MPRPVNPLYPRKAQDYGQKRPSGSLSLSCSKGQPPRVCSSCAQPGHWANETLAQSPKCVWGLQGSGPDLGSPFRSPFPAPQPQPPNHPGSDRLQAFPLPALGGGVGGGSNLPTQTAGCPIPGPSAISQPVSHWLRSVSVTVRSPSVTTASPLTCSRKACLMRLPAKLLAGESCRPSSLNSLHTQSPALAGAPNLPTVCQTQPERVHQLSA